MIEMKYKLERHVNKKIFNNFNFREVNIAMNRIYRLMLCLLSTVLLFGHIQPAFTDPMFAKLSSNLDEERGCCFDLSGFAENINWDRRLQAHTCNQNRSHGDQIIESSRISSNDGLLYYIHGVFKFYV